MRSILSAFFVILPTIAAEAACYVDLADFVGWEVVSSGTVTGYINENGETVDEFEGCEYGRVLIIDYSEFITCDEHTHDYGYRPDIVLLSNGYALEACINDRFL